MQGGVARARFLLAGAALALAGACVIVAVTRGDAAAPVLQRGAAVGVPTLVPFLIGAVAPAGRHGLWWVLAALTTIGWTSAAVGLRAARADASFAALHGWAACVVASIVALMYVVISTLRRQLARHRG